MIEISHTAEDGTTLTGDPRPHQHVLKGDGWRWSRQLGGWYVPRSRDRAPDRARIERARAGLEAAGLAVSVDIDETQRAVAEVEADRAQRASDRADRYTERAERVAGHAATLFDQADQMASVIPFGQPILVGHHSEGRDRRYRDRIAGKMDRAVQAHRDAEEIGRRAQAATATQRQRESGPTTKRRIEKLEAELRRIGRVIEGGGMYYGPPATGAHLERLEADRARIGEELDYWRAHLAEIGYQMLGKDDMPAKGSVILVRGQPVELVRANPKTVTVQTHGLTIKYGYEDVRLVEA